MTKRATFEEAQTIINNIIPNKYIIKSWPISGKDKCEIYDIDRDFTFFSTFSYLRDRLKINKNTVFFPTEEEQKLIYENQQKTLKEKDLLDPERKKKRYQKILETKKRLNEELPGREAAIRKKISETNMQKYGVTTPLQRPDVREKMLALCNAPEHGHKIKKAILEKYDVENVSFIPDIIAKRYETKKKNGRILLFNGKTLRELSEEKGCAYTTLQSLFLKTKNEDVIKDYTLSQTSLEKFVKDLLENNKINFISNKKLENKDGLWHKPDFLIEDKKLIIECDGLYWHSEIIKDDNYYHIKKKNFYSNLGYESLFFREDEIFNKPLIVQSIIKNKLKLNSNKIGASKCKIEEIETDRARKFFEENHLMGFAGGRCFGLIFNNEIVAAIIIRKKFNKKTRERWHDISRICSKIDYTIHGAVSKLIKHSIKEMGVKKLTTYIDMRYGSGEYLANLGFIKMTNEPSFKWTNFKQTIYRLNKGFANNDGYKNNFVKIWDCGQARWDLNI